MNKKVKMPLVIISGPSGVGKTVIAELLVKKMPILKKVVTCTTRPKRPRETNNKEYMFLSQSRFKQMIKGKMFFEWVLERAQGHGEMYGTPKKEVNKIIEQAAVPLLVINVNGAFALKNKGIPTVLIFIKPESLKQIEERIRGDVDAKKRVSDPGDISLRLKTAREELKFAPKYDYSVVNKQGKLDQTVDKIRAMLEKILEKQYKYTYAKNN